MYKTRIGVVRGGPSSEYEISLQTGAAVLNSLDKEKYEPVDIVISKSGVWHINGLEVRPHEAIRKMDVIFNALHGAYGEDGKIQQLLESHNIPFTGSGSLASAMAMAKHLAKGAFKQAGLKTPAHVLISPKVQPREAFLLAHAKFSLPYVIKPTGGGSSVGISLVKKREDFESALIEALNNSDSVLIEEYIPGVEATVGVIEGFRGREIYTLPAVEIRKSEGEIFDYGMKYGKEVPSRKSLVPSRGEDDSGLGTRDFVLERSEIVPATFSPSIKSELEKLAMAAHNSLGLRHYSRSDFIISPRRGIFILETNSLPGLTEESLVPKALIAVGSSLPEFVEHLIGLAQENS